MLRSVVICSDKSLSLFYLTFGKEDISYISQRFGVTQFVELIILLVGTDARISCVRFVSCIKFVNESFTGYPFPAVIGYDRRFGFLCIC